LARFLPEPVLECLVHVAVRGASAHFGVLRAAPVRLVLVCLHQAENVTKLAVFASLAALRVVKL
jgi:hypothetical protein